MPLSGWGRATAPLRGDAAAQSLPVSLFAIASRFCEAEALWVALESRVSALRVHLPPWDAS